MDWFSVLCFLTAIVGVSFGAYQRGRRDECDVWSDAAKECLDIDAQMELAGRVRSVHEWGV
jgi:hypothetical protein